MQHCVIIGLTSAAFARAADADMDCGRDPDGSAAETCSTDSSLMGTSSAVILMLASAVAMGASMSTCSGGRSPKWRIYEASSFLYVFARFCRMIGKRAWETMEAFQRAM